MGVAPLVAEVLARQQVKVTFFAANERTRTATAAWATHWAPWWKARAAEGPRIRLAHLGPHLLARRPAGRRRRAFACGASAGPRRGPRLHLDGRRSTARRSTKAAKRLQRDHGQEAAAAVPRAGRQDLAGAAGGGAEPAATRTWAGRRPASWATSCPARRASNDALLAKALRDVRSGDILVAHLGIWSRKDPWAPAVLEPLIAGLKARGLLLSRRCATIPPYRDWIAHSVR